MKRKSHLERRGGETKITILGKLYRYVTIKKKSKKGEAITQYGEAGVIPFEKLFMRTHKSIEKCLLLYRSLSICTPKALSLSYSSSSSICAGAAHDSSRIQSKNDEKKKTHVIHRWRVPLEIPKCCAVYTIGILRPAAAGDV